MAALMTRAAAMTLAAGVTLSGAAVLAPGLASAAPSDLSFGHCTPSTSPLVVCPKPKVRAGSTNVPIKIDSDLSFEISNLLAHSRYLIAADKYTLKGRDSKGLADGTGDDKRGEVSTHKGEGITLPLNAFIGDKYHIDPRSGSVTLTFSGLTDDTGASSGKLTLKFTILKATDSKTIKKLESAAAAAKNDEGELSYLLNIAKNKRSDNDISEIKRIEKETKSSTKLLGPASLGNVAVVAAPAPVGAVTAVAPASASRPAVATGKLAFTGAEIAGMSVVGLGLLGTGAFFVIAGRRRKGTAA